MPEPIAAWTIADLVDFEQLLASPADAEEDRRIFEAKICPRIDAASLEDRAAVFRAWLQARREQMRGVSAGEVYDLGRRSVQAGALVLGFFGGATLAGSLLAQGGSEPVNALLFLVWTVGLQWLLLALAVVAWALRRAGVDAAPLRAAVALALSAAGRLMRRLPGERRDASRAALARLNQRGRIRGGLLKWPVVIVMQQFALAFNLGILLAMLFVHLPFAELRFGWQSTYELEPEAVHRAIAGIAAPWSWFAPQAQPSIDDIRATRFTRGQSAQSLPSHAARSWWPFLALAVTCYGLLLRALLLAGAAAALRWRLRTVDFADADSNALWRRLRGPLVRTQGGAAVLPASSGRLLADAAPATGDSCVVLLSEEMALPDARLRSMLQDRFGWAVERVERVSIDDRHAAVAAMAALQPNGPSQPTVVVLAPASRDPIVAVALFLKTVVAAVAPREVLVLLCGDATGEAPLVDDERYAVWQRFIAIRQINAGLERWS